MTNTTIYNVSYSELNEFICKHEGTSICMEDCIEGCLIDNLLFWVNHRLVIAKETYKNCWCSVYTITYGDNSAIWDLWDELQTTYDEYEEV